VPREIYLDRNENNYGPAPACYEVLRRADSTLLSRYDRSFVSGSRGVLSARLAREFNVPEERIIVGYGAEQILKQAVQCSLPASGTLMVPAASWWYYKKIASEVGGRTVEYPMTQTGDRFVYDLEGMLRVYAHERPDVVFISSPNNPTGNSISDSDRARVLAEFRDSLVIIDEAYTLHDDTSYVTRLVDAHPRLAVLRTFSKYYALAGMRIGFAVIGKGLQDLAQFAGRYLGYHRLSEEVALAALDSPAYYREIARRMEEDKERYYAALGAIPGYTPFRSDANFLLVEIPAAGREDLEGALLKRGVHVKFMNEHRFTSHIRITLGTQEENQAVIDAITSRVE
jgi:histidinol-phosphate aminotransferase